MAGFKCNICNKSFSSRSSVSRHRITKHGVKNTTPSIPCGEDNCEEKFITIGELREHLQCFHGYENMNSEKTLNFKSEEKFHEWLKSEERARKAHFILSRGRSNRKDCAVTYYTCDRNGSYRSTSLGFRQLKSQGTKKINFMCCAQIILKVFKDHVEATYFKEHYKHDFLLSHLPLPTAVKDVVKEKLKSGVNDECIIDEINGSQDGEERHYLITKKDINNIKASLTKKAINNVKALIVNHLQSEDSIISNNALSVGDNENVTEDNGDTVLCHKEQGENENNSFKRSVTSDSEPNRNKKRRTNKDLILKELDEIRTQTLSELTVSDPITKAIVSKLKVVRELIKLNNNKSIPSTSVSKEPINKSTTTKKSTPKKYSKALVIEQFCISSDSSNSSNDHSYS